MADQRSLGQILTEHEIRRREGRTFGQAVVDYTDEPDLPFVVRVAAGKAVKAVVARWNDGGRSRDAARLAEQFPETGARVAGEFMGATRAAMPADELADAAEALVKECVERARAGEKLYTGDLDGWARLDRAVQDWRAAQ